MQARYLHRWTSAIDEIETEVIAEWAREITGLSAEQIRKGLDSLPAEWPPTAGEFRNLCLGTSDAHKENAAMYRDDRPRIKDHAHLLSNDDRDARREKAREELQKLKQKLTNAQDKNV